MTNLIKLIVRYYLVNNELHDECSQLNAYFSQTQRLIAIINLYANAAHVPVPTAYSVSPADCRCQVN